MSHYIHISQEELVKQGFWFPRDVKGIHLKMKKEFICGKQDLSTTVKKCEHQCSECKKRKPNKQ